jgi:tetratricopeptide (TPR) repeat protein
MWRKQGKYDKAIADYTKAISLNPKYAHYYGSRASVWNDKGDHDKAIADYTMAIQLEPKDPTLHIFRGTEWDDKREFGKAIADYTTAIQLDRNDELAYVRRGMAWASTGEYKNALSDYAKVINLQPSHAFAYAQRAKLLATASDESLLDRPLAIKDAIKACELSDWTNAWYLDNLATVYAASGDLTSAEKWQRKAIEQTDDDNKAEYRNRLRTYESSKTRESPE